MLVTLLVLLCHNKSKPSVENLFPPLLDDGDDDPVVGPSLGPDYDDLEKSPDAEDTDTLCEFRH